MASADHVDTESEETYINILSSKRLRDCDFPV